MNNYIKDMEEMINAFPPDFDLLKKSLLSKLKQIEQTIHPKENSILWSVEDFEHRAQELERGEGYPVGDYFDRNKFKDALHLMIMKHDAEFGITWIHVDYYLNEYCQYDRDNKS